MLKIGRYLENPDDRDRPIDVASCIVEMIMGDVNKHTDADRYFERIRILKEINQHLSVYIRNNEY